MLLAVSTPQKLGMAFAIALVIGWAIFIVAHIKRGGVAAGTEIELAPNRKPYYDDDKLESVKLERTLVAALILLVIIAIGLPLYWLGEPTRMNNSNNGFNNRAAAAGFILFQPTTTNVASHPQENALPFGCATCHGNKGQGGATSYSITNAAGQTESVQWTVPPLNTVLDRYTSDTVLAIITYGRANTPMPAWGINGGGAMNDQQLSDLVAYLQSIQLTPDQAKAEAAQYGTNGEELFNAYCARCHTKGYSYGQPSVAGGGAYGPNITGGSEVRQFAKASDQVTFVTAGVEYGKPYGARGVGEMAAAIRIDSETPGYAGAGGGMPFFSNSLTPAQIEAIVTYERGL
jgi:mono/diheme cytochrome c family protein